MKNKLLGLAAVLATGLLVAVAATFAGSQTKDCPGTVVCPITGKVICRDQCPLLDPSRSDCPGKLVCPLTGDLICRDECPLAECDANGTCEPRSCCQYSE